MGTELHRVVVTCIIWRWRKPKESREYLIVQRSPHVPYRPGEWTVPGGGLELSDWFDPPAGTAAAEFERYNVLEPALMRELAEECGQVEIRKPWLLEDYAFMRDDWVPVLGLSYVAMWVSGDVTLNDENCRFEWVTTQQSHAYDLIPDIHGELERAERELDLNMTF